MKTVYWVIFCLLMLLQPQATNAVSKVLLISMDGFRWDYLDSTNTPNFDKLISQGVRVKQVTNAFATITMPNHWTIVTGLYEEDHGIIANKFFDPALNDTYNFSRETKWYNSTEPLWITAERENVKSGSYMWVGNQAEYPGVNLTKTVPFKQNTEPSEAFSHVTEWFKSNEVDFVTLYIDEPDSTGHRFGPRSEQVYTKVREIDSALGNMMDEFEKFGLTEKVNIIIGSDHGMADVSNERSIDLSKYINMAEDIDWIYASAIGLVTPKEGKLDQVYNQLKEAEAKEGHFTVYKKENMPEELYYKDNARITPIVIVVDNGWLLKKSSYTVTLNGNHGFGNQQSDMKTTLVARGPDFKCGYKQDKLRSIDIYPLICHILQLQQCHSSPGSLDSSNAMLSHGVNCLSNRTSQHSKSHLIIMLVPLIFYIVD